MNMRFIAVIVALAIIIVGVWWLSTQQTGAPEAPGVIDQQPPVEEVPLETPVEPAPIDG